jgi:hypothetical protein
MLVVPANQVLDGPGIDRDVAVHNQHRVAVRFGENPIPRLGRAGVAVHGDVLDPRAEMPRHVLERLAVLRARRVVDDYEVHVVVAVRNDRILEHAGGAGIVVMCETDCEFGHDSPLSRHKCRIDFPKAFLIQQAESRCSRTCSGPKSKPRHSRRSDRLRCRVQPSLLWTW